MEQQMRSCRTINEAEIQTELKAFQENERRQRSSHDLDCLDMENKLLPEILVKRADLNGH